MDGTFATVGIDQIVSSVKMTLNIETTDSDNYFDKLINEAVRHLDCLSIFKKCVQILSVTNNMAALPQGFFRMIALRIGTDANCSDAIYVDVDFINTCGCSTGVINVNSNQGVYEIQGGYIIFHPNPVTVLPDGETIPSEVITSCTIAYFGMNMDEDCMMKVYEYYERALTAYVCWKYTQSNFSEYPQYVQAMYMQEWIAQKKWVKSIDFQNNFRNTRLQVQEIVNAVLVNKNW